MGVLDTEVALYETLRPGLEQGHKGEWVLPPGGIRRRLCHF